MPASPVLTATLKIGAEGRRAYIVDDVVDAAARPQLYEHVRGLRYSFADYDNAETKHIRHLVHAFDPEGPATRLLGVLEAAARTFLASERHRVGGRNRAYAPFNLFGDFQFAHVDGDEWTVLVFANERWDADWGGELMLYDASTPLAPAWAIRPEPGRMVIFDGLILHRGGVPSKHCLEPRISVALKFDRPATKAKRRTR